MYFWSFTNTVVSAAGCIQEGVKNIEASNFNGSDQLFFFFSTREWYKNVISLIREIGGGPFSYVKSRPILDK